MCRLFGMSGGQKQIRATFWLLDAPDSLATQSRREPDGTGLGTFAQDGTPRVDKQPIAAYEDQAFAREAREVESRTFVAHVRFASTGGLDLKNTHPFEQDGRLFAHNGVLENLPKLESQLGEYKALVKGDTDSERFFALITKETESRNGDIGAGITAAAQWAASNLPIYALNMILITPNGLWALRYPETHSLLVLEREAGGPHGNRHLDAASPAGTVRVRSGSLAQEAAVVIASEPMDDNPGWRPLQSGELLHVDENLTITSTIAVSTAPAHLLTLADLDPKAAASQSHVKTGQ